MKVSNVLLLCREEQQHQRPWPNVPTHQIMPSSVALPPPTSSSALPVESLSHQFSNVSLASQHQQLPVQPTHQPQPVHASPPRRQPQTLANSTSTSSFDVGNIPTLKYNQGVHFQALTFHSNVGKNVRLDGSATVAARLDEEFAQGYVFSRHLVTPGERLVVQVLATEDSYIGSLAFGLTNCDPSSLQVNELPEDSDLLLDRPEYWVVSKDVANSPQAGDELSFTVKTDGSVEFMKNNAIPSVFMHVDITQPLWAFWDIYGHTSRIRILGACKQEMRRQTSSSHQLVPVENGQEASELNTSLNTSQNITECIVCFDKAVDCVIYTCGHMCLCYECGLQQWRGRGAGFCPMCRTPIRDIIRTFKP